LRGDAATVARATFCVSVANRVIPAANGRISVRGIFVAANTIVNIYNQSTGGGSGGQNNDPPKSETSPNNNSSKDYNPQGRSKVQSGEDALDQLDGVTKKQENLRKGKGTGVVDSKRKSEQRVDNKHKKYRNLQDAIDDYDN
jgi:hypothetical protein